MQMSVCFWLDLCRSLCIVVSLCTPGSYSAIWSQSVTVSYKMSHQPRACLMTGPSANYPYSQPSCLLGCLSLQHCPPSCPSSLVPYLHILAYEWRISCSSGYCYAVVIAKNVAVNTIYFFCSPIPVRFESFRVRVIDQGMNCAYR